MDFDMEYREPQDTYIKMFVMVRGGDLVPVGVKTSTGVVVTRFGKRRETGFVLKCLRYWNTHTGLMLGLTC